MKNVQVRLPDDDYAAVKAKADARGLSLQDFVHRAVMAEADGTIRRVREIATRISDEYDDVFTRLDAERASLHTSAKLHEGTPR
jgi:uncharacterized protein (DUF1778 family)